MVSWKAGSRQGRSPSTGVLDLWSLLGRKVVSKRCLFENSENRTWHPKPTFYKSSALGPSKNSPRERFLINMKNNESPIGNWEGFYGPPKLKDIEQQTLFLILVTHENDEKTMPKGTSEDMTFEFKWWHGFPRFDLSFDFGRFGAMPKNNIFVDRPPNAQT